MAWTERQRAMLRELGVDQFWPAAPEPVIEAHPAAEAVVPPSTPTPTPTPPPVRRQADQASAAAPAAVAPPPPAVERPRVAGVERMDWAALRETVAACQACALCEGRTQAVFGSGHEQAHWMIVGEAPDEQEDLDGQPFVGRAGQLLDRMLQALHLSRSEGPAEQQAFVTHVIKCRPSRHRNAEPAEVAQCDPYLQRQIELLRPRVILAMGRLAAQALLKTDQAIGRLRGQVHEVQGIPVVVTFPPSYLLRNPADKGMAWDDLCRARALLQAAAPMRSNDQSSR